MARLALVNEDGINVNLGRLGYETQDCYKKGKAMVGRTAK